MTVVFATRMTVTTKSALPVECRNVAQEIPAGEVLTVSSVASGLWSVLGYQGKGQGVGNRVYVTSADLHRHTTHTEAIGYACDTCDGTCETPRFPKTMCRACKGKGRAGRTYKANA